MEVFLPESVCLAGSAGGGGEGAPSGGADGTGGLSGAAFPAVGAGAGNGDVFRAGTNAVGVEASWVSSVDEPAAAGGAETSATGWGGPLGEDSAAAFPAPAREVFRADAGDTGRSGVVSTGAAAAGLAGAAVAGGEPSTAGGGVRGTDAWTDGSFALLGIELLEEAGEETFFSLPVALDGVDRAAEGSVGAADRRVGGRSGHRINATMMAPIRKTPLSQTHGLPPRRDR